MICNQIIRSINTLTFFLLENAKKPTFFRSASKLISGSCLSAYHKSHFLLYILYHIRWEIARKLHGKFTEHLRKFRGIFAENPRNFRGNSDIPLFMPVIEIARQSSPKSNLIPDPHTPKEFRQEYLWLHFGICEVFCHIERFQFFPLRQ